MRYHDSLLDLVGETPLVRLRRVTEGLAPTVLAKVEYLNPGGSVKDRIALAMVLAAERQGVLRPGATIVEPTSGNTGVGLALVAQERGYRCVFTCPDKVAQAKRNVLTAYGAEVVVCPAAVPVDDPRSYRSTATRLAAEIPGAVLLDQYSNPENPAAHYRDTGPEIWRQTDGRITHFVTGVGTGGTISGIGRYLKEASGGAVQVIGVDPDGSVYAGDPRPRPYLVEGVGQPRLPGSFDPAVPDDVLTVADHDAIVTTRRLAREEGLLTGGSSGMAVAGALRVAAGLGPEAVVVVLLPDSGRGYLEKVFDDEWTMRLGLYDPPGDGLRLRDVLPPAPPVPVIAPQENLALAAKLLAQHDGEHLLVAPIPGDVRFLEAAGVVSRAAVTEAVTAGADLQHEPVTRHLTRLPWIGLGQSLQDAVAMLRDGGGAVLVMERGLVDRILTGNDLFRATAGQDQSRYQAPTPEVQ